MTRELRFAIYTADLFATGKDEDNRAAVRAVPSDALDLVGLAVRAPHKAVDGVVRGLSRHLGAGRTPEPRRSTAAVLNEPEAQGQVCSFERLGTAARSTILPVPDETGVDGRDGRGQAPSLIAPVLPVR